MEITVQLTPSLDVQHDLSELYLNPECECHYGKQKEDWAKVNKKGLLRQLSCG